VRRRTIPAIVRLTFIAALAAGAAGSTTFSGSAAGASVTQTFGPAADAYVSSANPSTNYGSDTGLYVETPRTGGAPSTPTSASTSRVSPRNGSTYGVLKLTLHASSYDWQFVPVAGQAFADSGLGELPLIGGRRFKSCVRHAKSPGEGPFWCTTRSPKSAVEVPAA
jgi:hypothetical protein